MEELKKKITKNLSQESWSPERDFKLGLFEYEASHNISLVSQYFTNPSRQISVVKSKLL
jgi:hypothetical protein